MAEMVFVGNQAPGYDKGDLEVIVALVPDARFELGGNGRDIR
jgi:hypothetical protein